MTEAIVYTSKHGSTEAYAGMLSDRTGIPAYTLKEALKKGLLKNSEQFMTALLNADFRGSRIYH